MTQDEIIRMAREAGWDEQGNCLPLFNALERFAAIVAAHVKSDQINLAYQQGYEEGSDHEREKLETPHECQTDGEKTAFAFGWFKAMEQIEAAVLAEREACAKVCDDGWKKGIGAKHQGDVFAVAIRARSQTRGDK